MDDGIPVLACTSLKTEEPGLLPGWSAARFTLRTCLSETSVSLAPCCIRSTLPRLFLTDIRCTVAARLKLGNCGVTPYSFYAGALHHGSGSMQRAVRRTWTLTSCSKAAPPMRLFNS